MSEGSRPRLERLWKPGTPIFTPEQAWEMQGKLVMVGLSRLDASGNLIEQTQFHGTVVRVNPKEGIVLQLDDGSERSLLPDFRSFLKALPGEYREHSTGLVVVNPDFLCSYTSTHEE
jgi:hypothetical protein